MNIRYIHILKFIFPAAMASAYRFDRTDLDIYTDGAFFLLGVAAAAYVGYQIDKDFKRLAGRR